METEKLLEKLKDRESKISKLREAVVALRGRSSEVEALCVKQRQQLEDLRHQHQERENELVRRCQDSELRAERLETEIAQLRKDLAHAQAGQGAASSREILEQRLVSGQPQLPSQGLQANQAGFLHSVVSVCKGSLSVLKAALAANMGPAADSSGHLKDVDALRQAAGNVIGEAQKRMGEDGTGLPSASWDKQSALEIAHVWLDYLLQGKPEKERTRNVAKHLVHELETRQAPLAQCVVGGVLSELMECGKSQADMLTSIPNDYDEEDSSRQQGAQALLGLTENAAIEDVSFTSTWCSEQHRQQATMTTLLICILSIHQQFHIVDQLQRQLSDALICSLMEDGSTHRTAGCVLASALVITHRYNGNAEAVRVLVLDLLLACRIFSWHAVIPVLTAALTAWPQVLSMEVAKSDLLMTEISHTIQELCRCILQQSLAEENDATFEGSMSCATTTAATPRLLVHSAHYLQRMGKEFWRWQDADSLLRQEQLQESGSKVPSIAGGHSTALKILTHGRAPLEGQFGPCLIAALRESF